MGFLWALLLCALCGAASLGVVSAEEKVFSQTFHTPPFTLSPGEVTTKTRPLEMPGGHVSIRSFNAELVDDSGASVPLNELYLHHWIVMKLRLKGLNASSSANGILNYEDALNKARAQEAAVPAGGLGKEKDEVEVEVIPNAGTCDANKLSQFFGIGSETRKTNVTFPAPYGVESGHADPLPAGEAEQWWIQVHAIDTRGAKDRRSCVECLCSAYNATEGLGGRPLPEGYKGGIMCCWEKFPCQTVDGFSGPPRTYHLRYTVTWVQYSECVVPLQIYLLDATDDGGRGPNDKGCRVEYGVHACEPKNDMTGCRDIVNGTVIFPDSGKLVYAVGHQHIGGTGVAAWSQDGRLICNSRPIYGNGATPGNENGYVTGMEVCPFGTEQGAEERRVEKGEKLSVRSVYDSRGGHTGVMGLMYFALVRDEDLRAHEGKICGNAESTVATI